MKNNIPSSKAQNLVYLKICEECGNTFYSKKCSTRFCSPKCNQISLSRRRKQKRTEPLQKSHHARTTSDQNNFSGDKYKNKDTDLLTVKEFAIRLGVCKQTVYNMTEAGHLRIIHFTNRLSYVSWSEFRDYLKNRHTPIPQPPSDIPSPICSNAPTTKWQQNNTELVSMIYEPPAMPKEKTKDNPKQNSLSGVKITPLIANNDTGLWLDVDEGCERYNMKIGAFYSYVSLHRISKKADKDGKMLYSQSELDRLRGVKLSSKKYITVLDACNVYSKSFATIYKIIRENNIEKYKFNGKTMFLQESLEKALGLCTNT